jgi:hypothetical protein
MKAMAVAGLLFLGAAHGSDFEFSDFAVTKDLVLMRDAYRSGKVVHLTDANKFQAGAIWYKQKQPVAAGFDTTFIFRLTDQDTGPDRGADGLAFVVQNEGQKVIGGLGASGGFMRSDEGAPGGFVRGIVHRMAVFFDTFANRWDASGNHIAICTDNGAGMLVWPPRCQALSQMLKVTLKDTRPHVARILYEPPRLSVFLDDMSEPVRVAAIDLADAIGGDGTAWVASPLLPEAGTRSTTC